MIGTSSAEEASASLLRFDKHAVAARVRWAIRDTMQNHMNVDSGTKRLMEGLAPSTVNDFFNRKIGSRGLFAMKQSCGNPNLIGDLQLGESLVLHKFLYAMYLHRI